MRELDVLVDGIPDDIIPNFSTSYRGSFRSRPRDITEKGILHAEVLPKLHLLQAAWLSNRSRLATSGE